MKKPLILGLFLITCATIDATPKQKTHFDHANQEETTTTEAHYRCNCSNCQQRREDRKQEKREMQQMAIATIANMAQGLVNIGFDPHNPTNVASNVTNIVGCFANFVAQAMSKYKKDTLDELLENEEFMQELSDLLINKTIPLKKQAVN